MTKSFTRRHFLHSLTVLGLTSTSGCLSQSNDTVVAAEKESRPIEEKVVKFSDLPSDEQEIARVAIEEGYYHVCETSNTARSLATRISDNAESAYLKYQESVYAFYIQVADEAIAMTGSVPESTPSCGYF